MRNMAVKEPMMMPMTNDIVGDIPRSDSVLEVSSSSPTSFILSTLPFFITFLLFLPTVPQTPLPHQCCIFHHNP